MLYKFFVITGPSGPAGPKGPVSPSSPSSPGGPGSPGKYLLILSNYLQNQNFRKLRKLGEISTKSSKPAPEFRRILIRRKVQKPGDS